MREIEHVSMASQQESFSYKIELDRRREETKILIIDKRHRKVKGDSKVINYKKITIQCQWINQRRPTHL